MKTSKNIQDLLASNLNARNNDKALYIEYIKEFSKIYKWCNEDQKQAIIAVICEMPEQASLKRMRAYIQNKLHKSLPLPLIKNNRRNKQLEIQWRIREQNSKIGTIPAIFRWFKKW